MSNATEFETLCNAFGARYTELFGADLAKVCADDALRTAKLAHVTTVGAHGLPVGEPVLTWYRGRRSVTSDARALSAWHPTCVGHDLLLDAELFVREAI